METHSVVSSGPLLAYLSAHFSAINKTRLKQMLKYGHVSVNGQTVTSHKHTVNPGDRIAFLEKKAAVRKKHASHLPFPVVYEDASLLVIDKPSGLLTMGTEEEKKRTAYWMITEYVRAQSRDGKGRVFIVHRLDREASGLVVFARTEAVKEKLQEGWSEAVKKYYAIVEGAPKKEADKLESYLAEDKFRRVFATGKRSRDSKHAALTYKTLSRRDGYSLLEVTLITGRKNQIRVQLADMGHPIAGDVKYGAETDPIGRLALHAFKLSFKHPVTGETVALETELPEEF